MKNLFKENLVFLKEKNNETYASIGLQVGVSANTVSNWVEQRSEPKISEVDKISQIFAISIHDLLYTDLKLVKLNNYVKAQKNSKNVKLNVKPTVKLNPDLGVLEAQERPDIFNDVKPIYHTNQLPKIITVDSNNNENISYVSIKARAGYALGYGDETFIAKLPAFTLPGYNHGHYRIFEVDGHSMFPTLHSADRVITRWTGISEVRDDRVYVIVTKSDGILIKRVINRFQEGKIIAKSDNNFNGEYPSLVIDIEDISEIWYVVERWTRQLPGPGEIYKRIVNLEAELAILKDRIK